MSGLVLTLSSEQPLRVPLARFSLLQGAFYRLLSADEALAAEVHDKPHSTDKQYKFFCFSDLHGRCHTEGQTLVFRGDVTWELRSADKRIVDTVRLALASDSSLRLADKRLLVTDVQQFDTTVSTSSIRWSSDTPVLYYRTDERGFSTYYTPTDPAFCAGLERGAARKYAAFFGTEPPTVHIALAGQSRKCVARYRYSLITGYYADFDITADPAVLTFLYETGLGSKNSMGFGTMKGGTENG